MKKTFTIIALLMAGSIAFSQQLNITQFATLNHNDTITAYYGSEAFIAAHNAAVHGDIITLSPGYFSPTDITKAVSIRGAGMLYDTTANRYQTTQIGHNFYLNVPNVAGYTLTIEGVHISGVIVYQSAFNPRFNKCRINMLRRYGYGNNYVMLNMPVFTNCIVENWDGASLASNPMFTNSIILNTMQGTVWGAYTYTGGDYIGVGSYNYTCGQSNDVYYNCIVNIPPNLTNNKRNIINCITYTTDTNATVATGTNTYNTVGIKGQGTFYSNTDNHGNINVNSFESIFKTFRGTYTAGETFELTDEAAATYLGSDGTQVGIYGGSAVFNPKATDMRIRKYSVGFYSDENGQLKITTELENE